MTVERLSDFDAFLHLEDPWNRLLERTREDTVFLRHEWFRCWWEAYGRDRSLSVLLIREKGALIGICPLMISRASVRGFPVTKIGFIENLETPRCDFIVSKNPEGVMDETIAYVMQEVAPWQILVLNNIPIGSDTPGLLETICRKRGIVCLVLPALRSPYLRIETDWDTFYEKTSQRFKKRLRYNRNRLEKVGHISVENIGRINQDESVLRDLFAIGQRSWKNGIGRSISCKPENRVFFSELGRMAGEKGWLSLWLMKADGNPLAFEYHLQYKGRVHALRSEFDEAYSAHSPGAVLESHIVRKIFQGDFKEYDMGGTQDDYKKHWTSSVREQCNVMIFNRGIYPGFLRFLEGKFIPAVRRSKGMSRLKEFLRARKNRR